MEYKHSDLTGRIIKCAYAVHDTLGCGFQEVIEMAEASMNFNREQEMPVYYRDNKVGERRVDFLVENVVSVEIKAVATLDNVHLAQAINYLEAFKFEVGLLINFGADKLEFKRLMKNARQLSKGNQISYSDYGKH